MHIEITAINKAKSDIVFGFFQTQQSADKLFQTVAPLMWKVFPTGDGTIQTFDFPLDLEICVIEPNTPNLNELRKTVKVADPGQHFDFVFDADSVYRYPNLSVDPHQKNPDSSISCTNSSPIKVDIGLSKDGKPLFIQKQVASGDQAFFLPTPKLYVLYGSNLVEGEMVRSSVTSDLVTEIDLNAALATGKVEISLSTSDEVSGRKQWSVRY